MVALLSATAAAATGVALTVPDPPPPPSLASSAPPAVVVVTPEPPPPVPPPVEAPPPDQAPAPEPDALLARARALCEQAHQRLVAKDLAGAAILLDQAEALAPDCGEVWFKRAEGLAAAGDPTAALTALERARRSPQPARDLVGLDALQGELLHRLRRPAEAIPYLDRAYRAVPEPSPELCYMLGQSLRADHRAPEALEPLERAVAAGVFGWRSHFHLAGVLRSCGRHEDAIKEYRRARAALDYAGFHAHVREGEALLDVDRPAEALPILEEGMTRRRGFTDDHELVGAFAQALVRTGAHAQGVEWAEKGIAMGKPWPRTYAAHVEGLLRLGRREEARASLEAADRLQTGFPDLRELAAELGP